MANIQLYITTIPSGCKVKILNIAPAFYNGIELANGRYKLEVSKQGYDTKIQWVDISSSQGIDLYVELEKQAAPSGTQAQAGPAVPGTIGPILSRAWNLYGWRAVLQDGQQFRGR